VLSKTKIKFINSLYRKKNREQTNLFIAEGEKTIQQLIEAKYDFQTIISTEDEIDQFSNLTCERIKASKDEIKKISSFKTPQPVIAVCKQQIHLQPQPHSLKNELTLALDDIQDPGNLGTIIRLASWFGIKNIICSLKTADCYNPKTIQATMGAIAHVNVYYTNLEEYLLLAEQQTNLPVYGTFLNGKNIYASELSPNGIIIMGNEGNGISSGIERKVNHKLYIPSFNEMKVESLNVSVATSIICSEFRRRTIQV
jgi:TrmH family RNA methyltransferase